MHEITIIVAKYGIIVPVVGYLYLAYSLRSNLKQLVVFTLISAILTALLVKIATILHSDPRPFVSDGVKPYFVGSTDNGFPSDHTVFSSLIAFIVIRYHRNLGLALLAASILIGAARVVSGVHHTQDIVAGVLIAGICVYLGKLISDSLLDKMTNEKSQH